MEDYRVVFLHELDEDQREEFVDGFAEAAREVWPAYDPDLDSLSERPFCRPWDLEPACLVADRAERASARAMGRAWFDVERGRMLDFCRRRESRRGH